MSRASQGFSRSDAAMTVIRFMADGVVPAARSLQRKNSVILTACVVNGDLTTGMAAYSEAGVARLARLIPQ